MIGVAQEKLVAWKGYKQGGSEAHPHFCYRRMSAFPNHYYFYVRDPDWGRRSSRPSPTPRIRCGCV
jgi:hypothetical protein